MWLEEHYQYSMWALGTGEDALRECLPNGRGRGDSPFLSRTPTNQQHRHPLGEAVSYRGDQRQRSNGAVVNLGIPGRNIAGASLEKGGITKMRRILLRVHQWLSILLGRHGPLLLVLALAGGLGRLLIGLSALLVVLTIVQIMLPSLRSSFPLVAAFHPVNGMIMVVLTAAIAHQARAEALGRHRRNDRQRSPALSETLPTDS